MFSQPLNTKYPFILACNTKRGKWVPYPNKKVPENCRKIAGKFLCSVSIRFLSVFRTKKRNLPDGIRKKKNGSVFFPFFFRIAFFKNGFFFASVFCPFFVRFLRQFLLNPFYFRFFPFFHLKNGI